jgi:arsenate reductase
MNDDQQALKVLFLSRYNSARSPMAECLLNAIGGGRYHAYSAGIAPVGTVSPFAIDLLNKNKLPADRLRSKDWQRFAPPGLLELDFVISVCELSPQEINAVWPGNPLLAHWFHSDPSASEGTEEEQRRAYFQTYNQLFRRLTIFASLPLGKLDRESLKRRLDDIGASES